MSFIGVSQAIDVGTYAGRATGPGDNLVGVSVGDKIGPIGIQATADRSTTQVTNVNRYTASVSYDVIKLGPVQTNVRVGFAYLDPQSMKMSNSGAGFVGAGLSLPVAKNTAVVADYAYQKGNDITKSFNGNVITAGIKYSF